MLKQHIQGPIKELAGDSKCSLILNFIFMEIFPISFSFFFSTFLDYSSVILYGQGIKGEE